jgi:hypothetical protein
VVALKRLSGEKSLKIYEKRLLTPNISENTTPQQNQRINVIREHEIPN